MPTLESPLSPVELRLVQPSLTRALYLARLPFFLLCAIAFVVVAWFFSGWFLIGAVAAIALALWQYWLIPRQVSAIGWQITETDLVIHRGILFESVTVIPLGRLQYVEVERGPIDSLYGLASITLHTASAASISGTIPGLTPEEASTMQKVLSRNGHSQQMGL